MSKEVKLEEKEFKHLKEAKVNLDKYKLAIGDLELQKKSLFEAFLSKEGQTVFPLREKQSVPFKRTSKLFR